jgi:hypothetical protein
MIGFQPRDVCGPFVFPLIILFCAHKESCASPWSFEQAIETAVPPERMGQREAVNSQSRILGNQVQNSLNRLVGMPNSPVSSGPDHLLGEMKVCRFGLVK